MEGSAEMRARIEATLVDPDGTPRSTMTSRLSELECRVRPIREGNTSLLHRYDEAFADGHLRVVEMDRDIVRAAADVRARFGLKTPDAIHAATAMARGADVFVTTDAGFRRCTALHVALIPVAP